MNILCIELEANSEADNHKHLRDNMFYCIAQIYLVKK